MNIQQCLHLHSRNIKVSKICSNRIICKLSWASWEYFLWTLTSHIFFAAVFAGEIIGRYNDGLPVIVKCWYLIWTSSPLLMLIFLNKVNLEYLYFCIYFSRKILHQCFNRLIQLIGKSSNFFNIVQNQTIHEWYDRCTVRLDYSEVSIEEIGR